MSHEGVPDTRYDNKSASLKFEICFMLEEEMKYDNVKAKVFPILLFLWLSPPVPTVSFQTLQINFFFYDYLFAIYQKTSWPIYSQFPDYSKYFFRE